VRVLTAAGLVCALATGFSLAVIGFVAAAQVPAVAAAGRWSVPVLRSGSEVTLSWGMVAWPLVVFLLGASVRRAVASGRELVLAADACRRMGSATGDLIVVDDRVPDAYAVPGWHGRVVLSTAMVQALPEDELRVLLAHEAAHLAHRHHLYVQLAGLAAAANPLLRPVARAVEIGVERWADEVAAAEVDDRRLTARAVARAAVARAVAVRASTSRYCVAPAAALMATSGDVVMRAAALMAAPVGRRRPLTFVVVGLLVVTGVAAGVTERTVEHRFERAHSVYAAHR